MAAIPSKKEESKAKKPLTKNVAGSKVKEAGLEYVARNPTAAETGMAKISSKHQITLPVEAVRRLGLEPGDRLAVRVEDDRIVLRPQPRDWVEYYKGRFRGVYGSAAEEIDEYIRKERESWQDRADRLGS